MMNLSLCRKGPGAFTLVELLVSMVVLIIILLMLVAMVNQTATIWRTSSAKIEQFRSARTAFESITRHLSQATLNTYYDYDLDPVSGAPVRYKRQSDLRFVAGPTRKPGTREAGLVVPSKQADHPPQPGPGHAIFFNAPLGFVSDDPVTLDASRTPPSSVYAGMENLLNTWGYFIEYGSDYNERPPFLNTSSGSFTAPAERYRYRLMEMMVPSDQITIYRYTSAGPNAAHYYDYNWFQDFLALPITGAQGAANQQVRPVHLLAENIATLVVYPQLSSADQKALRNAGVSPDLAPGYTYDTTPPKPAQGNATATLHDPETDPTNQLPPVVQVTMIALDEASAARAEHGKAKGADQPPEKLDQTLSNYFKSDDVGTTGSGQSALHYDTDLMSIQKELVDQKMTFRVFTSNVSLRSAKWSRN